eukprot:gene154-166_t
MACLVPIVLLTDKTLQVEMAEDPVLAADVVVFAQAFLALWLFSVWSWRLQQKTAFRSSSDMLGEFNDYFGGTYGEPMMKFVGFCKMAAAVVFAVTIVYPQLTEVLRLASLGIVVLMVGAVLCHVKIGDPALKSLPAFTCGCLAALVFAAVQNGCTAVSVHGGGDGAGNAGEDTQFSLLADLAAPESAARKAVGLGVLALCALSVLSVYRKGGYDVKRFPSKQA